MKDQTRNWASLVTIIIVLVIFIQINVLTIMMFMLKGDSMQTSRVTKDDISTEDVEIEENAIKWNLSIPKINVIGKIKDGTDEETINASIGHFLNTEYINGNVGLVAGCYGYDENYFEELEKMEKGDVILYQYGDERKKYEVICNNIIDEKDWTYLENTEENKITLITGVVNEPEKRRCVQATEII